MAVVVNKTGYQQIQGGDFSSRRVEQTTVTAQFTGTDVDIPNNCFLNSNHFIECTNGMLEGKKLRKFWYYRWMWQLHVCKLYVLYCIACFFVWIHLGVAIGMFIGSLLLLALSCQYITVLAVTRSRTG